MRQSFTALLLCLALLGAACTSTGESTASVGPQPPGEDDALDALWSSCAAGEASACDELYQTSEVDSEYEEFGATCAGLGDGYGDCAAVLAAIPTPPGTDKRLDALWVSCAGGDGVACEELYQASEVGSDYEAFGLSCGGRGETNCTSIDGDGTAQLDPAAVRPILDVAFTVISVPYSGRKAVGVDARLDGQPAAFAATAAEGGCFTATVEGSEVVVNGGIASCAGDLAITANGATETVRVNVFDPLSMDIGEGLLIRYTNDFAFRWNDAGSGADRDTGMYHPIAPPGYFPLGTLIVAQQANPTDQRWMVVASDSLQSGVLAPPTDYTFLWNDAGSGADNDGAVWQPVCPAGFASMGVVSSVAKPGADDVRCVAERYTAVGEPGTLITNDGGSGGDRDLSVNTIGPPRGRLPNNRTAMDTGAVSVNGSQGHYLTVELPVFEDSAREISPTLTACTPLDPAELAKPFSTRATRVPFSMLPGAISTHVDNVDRSPFFELRRETKWSNMEPPFRDNCQGSTGFKVIAIATTGRSNTVTDSFSKEVGVTVTAGGDIGPVSTEVSVSVTLGWSNEESNTYSTENSTTDEKCVPPGHFGQFLHQQTTFRAVNAQGVDEGAASIGLAGTKYLEWPSDGLTEAERGALC
ncbi:MAG: Vps62-related protein [Acidimicrobiales bacterium]